VIDQVSCIHVDRKTRNVPVLILRYLLRPVMKFCLRHSLKIQEIIDSCKLELISSAESEIKRSGLKVSISRLSVMTGIHRPDVMRLYGESGSLEPSENLVSRVIGHWQHHPRFLNAQKRPRVLNCEGKGSEFFELVESLSSALNPYTVLFDLERVGAVERTAEGVRLLTKEHIIRADLDRSFGMVSANSDDLIAAVEESVLSSVEPLNLHLTTEFDSVSLKKVAEIKRWLLKEGSEFHTKVRKYLAHADMDLNPLLDSNDAPVKVSVCAFSRVEAAPAVAPNAAREQTGTGTQRRGRLKKGKRI
jgi:hypothetical protein